MREQRQALPSWSPKKSFKIRYHRPLDHPEETIHCGLVVNLVVLVKRLDRCVLRRTWGKSNSKLLFSWTTRSDCQFATKRGFLTWVPSRVDTRPAGRVLRRRELGSLDLYLYLYFGTNDCICIEFVTRPSRAQPILPILQVDFLSNHWHWRWNRGRRWLREDK